MKTKLSIILLPILWLNCIELYSQESCKVLKQEIAETYNGKCKNGLAHGKGIADGKDRYEGEFKNGLPQGKGKYTWSTGETYDGKWDKGVRSGEGKYCYKKNGVDSVLVGIWKDDHFVKKITPRPYQVHITRDIDRYAVRKIGEGNMVSLSLERLGGAKTDVSEFSISAEDGLYREEGNKRIYYQLKFPVAIKINYTSLNKLRTFTTHPIFEITINEPGSWEIVLYN
jgi:hypothetical protein